MKFDMKTPLVSINLTTKNRSNFLKECIASILIQTYKNIELIIVDDGSTDDTAKVVDSYKKLLKIRYIKNKYSKGNACARNSALKFSNGKYIAFMDDDDFWNDQDKIKKQVDILENQKDIELVYTEIYILNENNNSTRHVKLEEPKSLIKHFLVKNSLIYSPTVLIRKSIFDIVGEFDEQVKKGVDSSFYRKNNYSISKN
jgi:Glycosyltransferases involved in cell wall biogenesis